jgi:HEAT repeat protein
MSPMEEAQPDLERRDECISRLMDEDEEARYDVARQIARLGKPVISRTIELAEDPCPRMREMACYILGQVGYSSPEEPDWLIRYPDGIPTLLRHLESDSDREVRATAAYALGFHAVPSTLPLLCRAATGPPESVRLAAAHALGSFYEETWATEEGRRHREEVTTTLLRLMDDEDEEVRDWATFGIYQGSHDTPAVRMRLFQALDDPYADVRGEAAVGLAEFGDRSLIPRLEQLLREDAESSPCYFEAAEKLGDPSLLPAVLEGAERLRHMMKKGEKLHFMVTSAMEALQKIANGNQESAS